MVTKTANHLASAIQTCRQKKKRQQKPSKTNLARLGRAAEGGVAFRKARKASDCLEVAGG